MLVVSIVIRWRLLTSNSGVNSKGHKILKKVNENFFAQNQVASYVAVNIFEIISFRNFNLPSYRVS